MLGQGPQGTRHTLYRGFFVDKQQQHWDCVLLQNQSQEPGFCRLPKNQAFSKSAEAAQTVVRVIHEQHPNAIILFLMTWGRRNFDKHNPQLFPDFMQMQSLITEGYQQYVAATSTQERPTYLAPVGLVFATIYHDVQQEIEMESAEMNESEIKNNKKKPTDPGTLFYQLYAGDGSHPSLLGSTVMALTIYATLTGNDVRLLNWKPTTSGSGSMKIHDDVMAKLKDAVYRTIQSTILAKTIRYPWQQV